MKEVINKTLKKKKNKQLITGAHSEIDPSPLGPKSNAPNTRPQGQIAYGPK